MALSKAMLAQGAKMKAAWKAVKAAGLSGVQARNKVRSMLRGDTGKSTRVARAPKRGGLKTRNRPRGPRRNVRRRQSSPKRRPVAYRTIPFMMKDEDIAGGEYRDPAQETAHATFTSGGDLQKMTQSVKSSQQGLRPNLRPYGKTRLMLATAVMGGGGQDDPCWYSSQ